MRIAPSHPSRRAAVRRAALAFLLAVSACSITEPSRREADAQELARNRLRWQAARLRDYEFDYQLSCFCGQETTEAVHIVVRGDALASVTRRRDGMPADPRFNPWPRVDELFADVDRYIAQGAEQLEVSYDSQYGYPTSIVVDIQAMAADDESSQSAGNLHPLP